MGKVYLTGDKHGDYSEVRLWCAAKGTTKEDLLIVLGDNGVNYYGPTKDRKIKQQLAELPITFFMIKGNHDQRPSRKLYRAAPSPHPLMKGMVLSEADYPSLLFAPIHGSYQFQAAGGMWKTAYVLGGAYSVDKWYRLDMQAAGYSQYRWFSDEQMTEREMQAAEAALRLGHAELILSHTCPNRYIPTDMFIRGLDQSLVDRTMELWMDGIEQTVPYEQWYCGHWHTDRNVDNMRFMYRDIIELE